VGYAFLMMLGILPSHSLRTPFQTVSKSFENDATNLKLLALITFGEGLHNNHHARPASPKLSAFRGEFDPAWSVIRLLEKLRLAEVLTKVDEGWENHRRRISKTVVSPVGTSSAND
jgi:hypothetical protein